MKKLNRKAMMKWIKKQGVKFCKTTEEFNPDYEKGIWLSAEDDDEGRGGLPLYDWYAQSKLYECGVLESWGKKLRMRGWYSDWYDGGTVMLSEI